MIFKVQILVGRRPARCVVHVIAEVYHFDIIITENPQKAYQSCTHRTLSPQHQRPLTS